MKVMSYRTQEGIFHVLLVKVGPKWCQYIMMDSNGIRIRRAPAPEVDNYMVEMVDYPLRRALQKYKRAGIKFGITKPARKYIMEALND